MPSFPPAPSHAYTGRFAPSPTGPLHFGSLVAALASFLDARAHGGQWMLRMEDIDPPREEPGAADAILRCLDTHHLHWDGKVLYQSTRYDAYREVLQQLEQQGLTYRCTCSRQELQGGIIYSGHCRHRHHDPDITSAIRLDISAALNHLHEKSLVTFDDLIQGTQQQDLFQCAGDFVIHRKDGLFAYQLAVAVDDIFQNVTHVIRGTDLLDSTTRQILLFKLLRAPPPVFGHVPLVLNEQGQKLSKQNLAPALDGHRASNNLYRALCFLHQEAPASLARETPVTLLQWAVTHWQPGKIAPGAVRPKCFSV